MDMRIVELSAAIRMTCRSWLKSNTTQRSSLAVTFSPDAAHLTAALTLAGRTDPCAVIAVDTDIAPAALAAAFTSWTTAAGALPAVIAVRDTGVFAVAATTKETTGVLDQLREGGSPVFGGLHDPRSSRRLSGCVAVVTGSAQGFGKGIAEELILEGAMVTIADVNDPLGHACVKELEQRFGAGCAIYAHADVSNLASTQEMLYQTSCAFGGIDMFVANAGVLKAGSLEEMDEKAFDLVTTVNYKGFFIGVKAVAPFMKAQHRIDRTHFMDIVQINSKSGLQGSNKNFAYAGGKFGGIGLTQSFAMELVEYNIKVNSICPGNFFEGPLWSDPEKGLFVQYLRAGKVAGAKTIEDVKQSYVSKVPMKRGCSPRDVARAIFYVYEQEYETGQAVPVTGGQVMLN